MTTDTTTKDTAAGAPAPGTVVLDARGVTMRFGGLTAVRDVDLTVRSGEIVVLVLLVLVLVLLLRRDT
ncbi:hypothetical protein ABZ476_32875, partial [Streptomyces albogriseolus]